MIDEYLHRSYEKFALHLRSVHFVLITTCFAICAAALLTTNIDIDKALDQLRIIESVVHRWEQRPMWLDDYAHKYLKTNKLLPSKELSNALKKLKLICNYGNRSHYHQIVGPWFTVRSMKTRGIEVVNSRWAQRQLILIVPKTLADFRRIWNILDGPIPIAVPIAIPSKKKGMGELVDLHSNELNGVSSGKREEDYVFSPYVRRFFEDVEELIRAELGIDFSSYGFNSTERKGYPVPVKTFSLSTINGQVAMMKEFQINCLPGRFNSSYPELSEITKNYQDAPFASVLHLLKQKKRRTGERIEVFGTKIPTQDFLFLAMLCILIVQIYFSLHIFQFKYIFRAGFPVAAIPWIGLYRNIQSKILTSISAIVLPAFIVVFFCVQEAIWVKNSLLWIIAGVLVIMSLGIAGFTFKGFVTLWSIEIKENSNQTINDDI